MIETMPIYQRLSLVGLAVVCLAGAALRLGSLATHRTHVDDLGVALTIIDARKPGYFQRRVNDRKSPTFETGAKQRLRALLPSVEHPGVAGAVLDAIAPVLAVSMSWTYAPLQFVATAALLPRDGTYRQNLFWGRLPSALCGCFALFLLVAVVRRGYGEHWHAVALLAACWFGVSWEHIIFSQQMSSYAIGTFAVLIGVWLYLDLDQRIARLLDSHAQKPQVRAFAGYGAALAVLIYAQYQMLFFGVAALIALALPLVSHLRRTRKFSGLQSRALLALAVSFAALTLPVAAYVAVKGFSAINWNAGPNNEFAFVWESLRADPLYFVKFFVGNAVIVTGNLLAFLPEGHAARAVLDPAVSVLCLVGLIRLLRASSAERRALGVVIATFVALWGALVLARRITLSPTRHSLILLPLLLLCMSEAWFGVLEFAARRGAGRPWLRPSLSALCVLAISAGFLSQYSVVSAQRSDPFSAERVRAGTLDRGIPTVLHDGIHLPLMRELTLRSIALVELNATQRAKVLGEQQPLAVVGIEGQDFRALEQELHQAGYRQFYSDETLSPIELELSQRTSNGFNNYVLYLYEPRQIAAH